MRVTTKKMRTSSSSKSPDFPTVKKIRGYFTEPPDLFFRHEFVDVDAKKTRTLISAKRFVPEAVEYEISVREDGKIHLVLSQKMRDWSVHVQRRLFMDVSTPPTSTVKEYLDILEQREPFTPIQWAYLTFHQRELFQLLYSIEREDSDFSDPLTKETMAILKARDFDRLIANPPKGRVAAANVLKDSYRERVDPEILEECRAMAELDWACKIFGVFELTKDEAATRFPFMTNFDAVQRLVAKGTLTFDGRTLRRSGLIETDDVIPSFVPVDRWIDERRTWARKEEHVDRNVGYHFSGTRFKSMNDFERDVWRSNARPVVAYVFQNSSDFRRDGIEMDRKVRPLRRKSDGALVVFRNSSGGRNTLTFPDGEEIDATTSSPRAMVAEYESFLTSSIREAEKWPFRSGVEHVALAASDEIEWGRWIAYFERVVCSAPGGPRLSLIS